MRMTARPGAKTTGFTLIELLVVIAIVAVIAAILLPVFATVRERGRRTVCQSNLKQLALAMQQYVQDNNGTFPLYSHWSSAAYGYAKSTGIFRCPTHPVDEELDMLVVDPLSVHGSFPVDYTYNMPRVTVEANLATPATIMLNRDSVWMTNDNVTHFGRLVEKSSCGQPFGGSTLHSGGGNYSYVDGHVKWLTPEEAAEVECLNGPMLPPFKS